ncbi:MAG: efflux RND transporter permease subunit [Desulfatiglandaceae bacterium]
MIWNFCIRRPVLTVVIFLIIGIFGLYGYFRMPVRENPDIEFPVVSVNVVLAGAEPEVIETEIIDPLEEEINTVEGLKKLTSTAREQVGTIVAEFELWRDIDIATQDVRDRVNRAMRELPDDVEAPLVSKLDPDAYAIMWIALTGDRRWDELRLTRYADEVIKERLENIKGVGRIQIGGERRYAVRLRLDPEKLAAYHVTVGEVVDTVRKQNVDIPTGRIQSKRREFIVKTLGQFESPEPINDLIVAYHNGGAVRIRDVGKAEDGVENDRQVARFSGQTTVGLGVVKQSDANTVALAAAVRKRMAELEENFPAGLSYTVAADDSEYIQASISDLVFTIFLATGLVVLVILGFLRNWWGTLITTLAIPASLLGGLAVMHALGFSINTLTMLGLILAIGIVIDDAIVVLESAYRHAEKGAGPKPAARVGTTEVAFAAITNTLSLSAVFIPVAFTPGLIGRFFHEFGLTVAATVFASTFTALSLTPMLSSRLLRIPERRGSLFRWSERVFESVETGYAWLLERAFRRRLITVLVGATALGTGLFFFFNLSREFVPTVDRSQFIISFETPEGATLAATNAYARQIEMLLGESPEVKHQFMAIGLSRGGGPGKVNEGIVFVRLVPRKQRQRHQTEIAQELRRRLAEIAAGQAFVIQASVGVAQSEAPVQLVLEHSDIDSLARQQESVMAWMRRQSQFIGVNSDLKMNKPQITVRINREKASQMGIRVTDISNTMRFLLGEPDISEIERDSERYEIIPEIIGKEDMTPDSLRNLYVRSAGGSLIPLDNLIHITETVGPSEIPHFNRLRSATISSSLPPGVSLGGALKRLETYLTDNLPSGFEFAFTGQSQDFRESFYYLTITIGFSLLFVYLVLSAQFESFIHPFTILLTVPLAVVGALGALWIAGMSFGIVAFIGLIMLVGMATKNAILMIDFSNVLIARGINVINAAKEAARVRFRPVIMTTLSTVLGITPIALGLGAGGEARAPMGVAVASGLLATTGLTLLIIPVVYTLLHQFQQFIVALIKGLQKNSAS